MRSWKTWVVAASLACAGAAWADGPESDESDRQRDPFGPQEPGSKSPRSDIGEPPPQPEPPTGGWPGAAEEEQGIGGAGAEGIPPEDVELYPPVIPEEGINGAEIEDFETPEEEPGTGGAGTEGIPPEDEEEIWVIPPPVIPEGGVNGADVNGYVPPGEEPGTGGAGTEGMPPENGEAIRISPEAAQPQPEDQSKVKRGMRGLMGGPADMRGLTVMGGGGVEGYTGAFAGDIDPGVTWGVVADVRPWSVLGLELGYSGAANEVDSNIAPGAQGAVEGRDLVRHGGHAAVIVGAPTPLQPYVLGGIGVDRYSYRGADGQFGFQDDTAGSIPLAAGLRAHAGDVTADFRLGYDALFDDEFEPGRDSGATDGRLKGVVQIGGTF